MRIRKLRCALLLAVVVFPMLPVYIILFLHGHPQQQQQLGESFITAVSRYASDDKYIILSVVDEPVIDMALNLHESSFKPYNIRNFLFVSFDRQTCAVLTAASLPCFHYADLNVAQDKASVYNSVEFLTKMTIRNDIVLETLTAGFAVLLIDLDIIFLRNPMPNLKAAMKHADVCAMWDSNSYNGGFIVIRPTANGIKLWQLTCRMTSIEKRVNDQKAFNDAVRRMNGSKSSEEKLRFTLLDSRHYTCGRQYFEDGRRLFPHNTVYFTARNDSGDAWVLHNNWIVSYEAKVYRFKEHLMWTVDKDGYYSNTSNKYLIYNNSFRPAWSRNANSCSSDQLEALKSALAIGRILNRIVILPRFHCVNGSRSYDCPLNSILYIPKFDSQFKSLYRESSFLHHPRVPDAVRMSTTSQLDVINRKSNEALSSLAVTSDELLSRFGNVTTQILRLGSLYDVRVKFTSLELHQAFNSSFQNAVVQCDYRQQRMKDDSAPKRRQKPKKKTKMVSV